jgi:hypothetical protein
LKESIIFQIGNEKKNKLEMYEETWWEGPQEHHIHACSWRDRTPREVGLIIIIIMIMMIMIIMIRKGKSI